MELSILQDQVRKDEERALSQYVSDNLLRVLVIVKRPLLALRYNLPSGQIRKTQMNFVPHSGCDVALETFRAAGLPIRDKDVSQVESQRPSSQSQPQSQERPGSLKIDQAACPPSSQGLFPNSSQALSEGNVGLRNAGSDKLPPSTQPTKVNVRPLSAPNVGKQNEFSRLISASSRSTLNAFGSPITVTSAPTVAKPRPRSGLLPSPVFNGTYEPFGSVQVRPLSAPEQTQSQRDLANMPSHSQMLPPERTLPFPEKKIHQSRMEEAALQGKTAQEKPAVTKTKAKRQTNTRTQPAKPRKSRAKAEATTNFSDPLAPSSPSPASRVEAKAPAPSRSSRFASPEVQATPSLSESSALPRINSRKRSLTDRSVNQPNKRQTQISTDTVTENMTRDPTRIAVAERSLRSGPTDPLINTSSRNLLETIDNLMRRYHDPPAPKAPSRTSQDCLAEYAAQSEADRVKAIDDLIHECIKDENFTKLMEDVEGAWKSIGLAL